MANRAVAAPLCIFAANLRPDRGRASRKSPRRPKSKRIPALKAHSCLCDDFGSSGTLDGGRTRARTWDPMIKSHLLYQLSYAPGSRPGKPSQEGRRLAKRPADVQQGDRVFPVVPAAGGNARSRGIPGFSSPCAVSEDLGSEALRSAAVTMIPAAAVVTAILLAVGSAIEAAVAPSSAEPAFHARQDRQPAL